VRPILCLGIRVARYDKGRVTSLDIEAAKTAVDFWKPTSVGHASCYVCENSSVGNFDPNMNHPKTVFELQDVEVKVGPRELSAADKLNKVEWRGSVSLHYTAVRSYSPPDKAWSQWLGSGFVEDMVLEKIGGVLKQPQGLSLLQGTYHGRAIGETFGGGGTTTILLAHPKQVDSSDLPK